MAQLPAPSLIEPQEQGLVIDGLSLLYWEAKRRNGELAGLQRIAVALCDADGMLRTYLRCGEGGTVLNNYQAPLKSIPSLSALASANEPRVIDDLLSYSNCSVHAGRVVQAGMRSSYTVPLMDRARLKGFLFFNSPKVGYFTPSLLHSLWPYTQMAGLLALREIDQAETIRAAADTLRHVSRSRDEETGGHLDRMAAYCRLIARELVPILNLSDEFVEFTVRFAPLHDVGKVAVPDSILLKPGRLDPSETLIMQSHVARGGEIVEHMLSEFGFSNLPHAGILRSIVTCHHESWDGTGYPHGLSGPQIPLEAAIIKVADVFDALTSVRPYKQAWNMADAFAYCASEKGKSMNPLVVDALLACREPIREARLRLADQ